MAIRVLTARLPLAALALTLGACDDPLALPPPSSANAVDTVTVYALTGTSLSLPSGLDIVSGGPARTDRAEPFDLAFDLTAGGAVLYPAAAIGVNTDAALLVATQPFDQVLTAPTEGFQRDSGVTVTAGMVLVARSRSTNQACALLGSLPRYAKLEVLAINPSARSITLKTLINANCGYRDLEPGFPEN